MRRTVHWPHNKKICATFTVAFEAYLREGHHKTIELPGINMVAVSHASLAASAMPRVPGERPTNVTTLNAGDCP